MWPYVDMVSIGILRAPSNIYFIIRPILAPGLYPIISDSR